MVADERCAIGSGNDRQLISGHCEPQAAQRQRVRPPIWASSALMKTSAGAPLIICRASVFDPAS
jgi:hypothetical protein